MPDSDLPVLYVKTACAWCKQAIDFLDEHGFSYRQKNVTEDLKAFEEMKRLSGQTKAPTLSLNGDVLPDFGLEELVPFLRNHNVKFEDS
ncbi:MAG TPA: glutaredoxin family protein [Opitutaceae bacterium]|nr:glutaredoxin family protein [Opitutaceae bacterium]